MLTIQLDDVAMAAEGHLPLIATFSDFDTDICQHYSLA
jgi:hypothetical protein